MTSLLQALSRSRAYLQFGLICSALLLGPGLTAHAATQTPDCYFVFLNKGEGRSKLTGMAKEDVTKMQADHVGNLGTLHKQGRGLAAGPLGDNGFIRGIVVLNVTNQEAVADCFKPDPFVQNNILAVEAYPWLVDIKNFHNPVEPFEMAKHTLVVVKPGKDFTPAAGETKPDALVKLLPSLQAKIESGELAVGGPLVGAKDRLGVMLFFPGDSAKIQAELEQEPEVKQGHVVLEFHPQYMGAGVLHGKGDASVKPATTAPK